MFNAHKWADAMEVYPQSQIPLPLHCTISYLLKENQISSLRSPDLSCTRNIKDVKLAPYYPFKQYQGLVTVTSVELKPWSHKHLAKYEVFHQFTYPFSA
jgi:hypothetical protein